MTRAEIEEIRGVSVSGGTLDLLIELGWVRLGRRKLAPGRPMTFVVTQGFLDHFGLESDTATCPGLPSCAPRACSTTGPIPQVARRRILGRDADSPSDPTDEHEAASHLAD